MQNIQSGILKQAQFLEGMLESMKGELSKGGMFEKVFSILGPMIAWEISKPLGILFFLGEHIGYGPGEIGRLIDQMLGSDTQTGQTFSDSQLKGAAASVVDKVLTTLGLKHAEMLRDVFLAKGSIDLHDLVAIAASGEATVVKYAAEPGRIGAIRGFLAKALGGQRLGLANGLYLLIKWFVKGLVGIGLVGGLAGATKGLGAGIGRPSGGGQVGFYSGITPQVSPSGAGFAGRERYENVQGNVEKTIIYYLDKAYKVRRKDESGYLTFSQMFMDNKGYSLAESEEMNAILQAVGDMNFGGRETADRQRTFLGPSLASIAKVIMPTLESEQVKPETGAKPTARAVPSKPASPPPRVVSPPKAALPQTDKLRELLRGIYNE
jgi:hypothetical protein